MRTNQINAFLARQSAATATLQLKPEAIDAFPWDAPVHVERLFTASGIPSDRFAVIASPTHGDFQPRVVGGYVKGDALLSNRDAIAATEAALESLGFEYTRETRLCRDGGGFEAVYTVTNYPLEIGHSSGMPQVKIRNSYDGVWKVSGSFSVLMLVCLNGLMTMKEVECLSQKHSSKLDISDMADKFSRLISMGSESAKSFERLADYRLESDIQAANLFGNISRLSKGGVSKRNAAEMLHYYLNPDAPEKGLEPSLWRAYMAATRMVRDLNTVRPTVAGNVNGWIGNVFGLVVDRGGDHFGNPKYLLDAPPAAFSILEVEID